MPEITWTLPTGHQAATPAAQTVSNGSDLTAVKEVASGATGVTTVTTNLSAAPLGSLRMSCAIRPKSDTPGGGDPTPTDPPVNANFKYAKINGVTFPISGINPGSTGGTGGDTNYPGGRGPNQLILYTNTPVATTVTNEWGCEVPFGADLVIDAVNDRQPTASGTGTSVPASGYCLSGHGTARDFLVSNAVVGQSVTLLTDADPNPTPGGDPTPVTGAYPVRAISVYKMCWSTNGPNVSSIPSGCNVIRLAFGQGSPPGLVGYGSEGSTSFKAGVASKAAAGVRIILSLGGQGGAINTSNRTAFMQGVANVYNDLSGNLHGIDWDIEASSLNRADVLWISQQVKATYGANFAVTFVPNGGNVSQYLPAAVDCYRAGVLDEYGQQFYDAPVSLSAAKGRINEAIGAGIPESKISVGMMIANDANHWTNDQCRTYMASIRADHPGITKAYLWEASRSGTSQWITDMQAVIGS